MNADLARALTELNTGDATMTARMRAITERLDKLGTLAATPAAAPPPPPAQLEAPPSGLQLYGRGVMQSLPLALMLQQAGDVRRGKAFNPMMLAMLGMMGGGMK